MSKGLEGRLASLTPDRIKLLVDRLQASPAGARTRAVRMPRNDEGRYPLSGAQERMWFLCQLSPGSPVFNNPAALWAYPSAPLDRVRLERAMAAVVARHEILRTTFHARNGRPEQVIHPEMLTGVGWDDLRPLPAPEREAAAVQLAYDEGRQPFDLAAGPLMALRVVQLADLEYLLLVTSHHIISDGWSNAMFSKELSAIYSAGDERTAGLAPIDGHYVDYVAWERAWLQSDASAGQIAYWRRQLSERVEPVDLPADRARPAAASHDGGMVTAKVPAALSEAIRQFGKTHRISLFQVLMGGLIALLHRYTGESTVTVGTLSANRNRREFQHVMGLFMNTLVIRARVDAGEPFLDLARRVQTVCQDAMAHQDLPFDRLIGELKPPRRLNVHPLFQVMFVHQNVPAQYEVPGMRLEVEKIDYGNSKFDLNFWAEELNDELRLTLHYSRDLFDAATADRILAHYQAMLESAVAAPDAPVQDLAYFEDFERKRVSTARPTASPAACIHRRFETQVELTPDAVAADGPAGSISYRAMNAEANQLARHLQSRGATAGAPIALLVRRTPRSLAALFGILKAGGHYLPLDPSAPAARLELLLRDAGCAQLVTEDSFRTVAAGLSVQVTCLDADAAAIAAQPPGNLDEDQAADSLAYLIYTSGTTGTPKGVAISHGNLAAYCDAIWPVMGLSRGDRCATVSSLAADLGNTMIFPPLLNGGAVVLVPESLATDASGLADYLEAHPIDALKIVPTHLRALMSSARAAQVLPRRLLVLGGEASHADLLQAIRSIAPGLRIVNHYGPTETTIGVLTFDASAEDVNGPLPLGFPLEGARVYVLDASRRRVPPGVSGEIYIGGATVARGYLNRPELTAERFVDDPFVAGERLYRTGDRAVVRHDGAIVFQGRVDRQVKVRGFRVELAEIEHALAAHADVQQAVVLFAGEPPRLSAFVQARPGSSPDRAALEEGIRGTLPSHMLPNAVAVVSAIPLTPNGKIDYDALSKLDAAEPPTVSQAPRDAVELELAHIWADVLNVSALGIDDDFFDLGGHSLLATQLMARIEDRCGVRLPLSTLFEHGTIRRMAGCIRAGEHSRRSPLVAIQPRGAGIPVVFVHPAGGNVLCYHQLAQALGSDVPFYALQALPSPDEDEPSIAGLARTYLDAMLGDDRFTGQIVLGGWSMGALVAFEIASLLAREHGRTPCVAVLDQPAPGTGAGAADDEVSRMGAFARKVSELVGAELGITEQGLETQTPDERARMFLDRFIEHQLAPETTTVSDFRGFLDLMLTHNRITGTYTAPPYPGRIVVFRADATAAAPGISSSPRPSDLGWGSFSRQPLEVVPVPGTHISMMRDANVRVLADRFAACLLQRAVPAEAR
ncbi:MAG: amino acid adenylation domain-containing protein [Acidobacteriota bacterium]|nr:amino acid adenylation domain-containing protein [Acidobacteriota bacterium]